MAGVTAAIDHGMPLDVVLNTGQWSSLQVFTTTSTTVLNSML